MDFLSQIWSKAKKLNKTIVLPETEDSRVLKASDIITKSKIANIILIGNKNNIEKEAKTIDADISNTTIIDPLEFPKIDVFAEKFILNMKKHNKEISFNEAKKIMQTDYPFFGAMLVAENMADGMVSGASHSTGHTIKSAIYCLGLKEGINSISSFFVMITNNKSLGLGGILFFADCGVIPDPTPEQLKDIVFSTSNSYKKLLAKTPRIALLSYSTKGSAKALSAEKARIVLDMVLKEDPEMQIDGELQFDAAVVPSIAKRKAPESKIGGKATILIFPDLDAGNIGYKIAERIGGAMALGPILQGCAKPINDLSRGCSIDDIVNICAITAIQSS